jgi:hypothetical protein
MKVLVCGSRDWPNAAAVYERVRDLPTHAIVINGCANGADSFARGEAYRRGLFVADVPVTSAHWRRHGPSAGPRRNHAMLDLGPTLVIAFQHNGSSGTQSTIDEARRRGIPVEVHTA